MIYPNIFGHCTYFFGQKWCHLHCVFCKIAALALEKTIWLTINIIQLNDAKFITLLVCQTDKDKKERKVKYTYIFNLPLLS